MKKNTSLRSEFIVHNSGHSEFIYHKYRLLVNKEFRNKDFNTRTDKEALISDI